MNDKHWSIHVEFLVIFVTLLGGYFMIQQDISMQTSRIDQVNVRSDQLFQMFCTLQKEMKDEMIELKKEHYEFMRERK